jgi:Na+/H+ antiporter NhaD/arsenite permease-like protein
MLSVAAIGCACALLTLICTSVTSKKEDVGYIIRHVDYKTLLFFIGLFIVVGGLEETKVLEIIAGFLGRVSGGNISIMIGILIWLSAVASAFVDNIPFAATMVR